MKFRISGVKVRPVYDHTRTYIGWEYHVVLTHMVREDLNSEARFPKWIDTTTEVSLPCSQDEAERFGARVSREVEIYINCDGELLGDQK